MATPEPSIANYDESLILDSVDRFLERDVRPHVRELEENDIWPAEIVEKMKELGLFGATIGEEYGGLGLSASIYSRIVERVSAVWMSVSGIFNSHLIMAAAIERFGTEAQKRRYLPRCASGDSARRGRADRARLRDGPAGDPHPGGEARRPLRGQRHQDVDQQQRSRKHSHRAGEDRSGRHSSPQGHEPAHRRKGLSRLQSRTQAQEDRLQGHRYRRAGIRRLRGPGRESRR